MHRAGPDHVRFGSLGDIASYPHHVRFTPESGHSAAPLARPFNARGRDIREMTLRETERPPRARWSPHAHEEERAPWRQGPPVKTNPLSRAAPV